MAYDAKRMLVRKWLIVMNVKLTDRIQAKRYQSFLNMHHTLCTIS